MSVLSPDDVRAIYGAYRLARFDAGGFAFLDRTPAGALRSFRAALLIFPVYCALLAMSEEDPGKLLSPSVAAVELIAYVINFTAYAAVMIDVTRAMGIPHRYFGYLAAYNWSALVQVAVYFPVMVVSNMGLLPDGLGNFLVFAVTIAILVYQGFIARVALGVSIGTAVLLVLMDLVIALVVSEVAESISAKAASFI